MIAAVMQPYLFPYIGYFQLMKAVDTFVFLDDVQYINRGWVNRNRIASNGHPQWLTFPVKRNSRSCAINQREYLLETRNIIKHKLNAAYRCFPYFDDWYPLFCDLIDFDDSNVAKFNAHALHALASAMGLECNFLFSSLISKPVTLKGQEKIIDICKGIGATRYINPIGGVELYDYTSFRSAGLSLEFLRTNTNPIEFAGGPEHLSIIDRLIRDGFDRTVSALKDYELISTADLCSE